MIFLWMLLFTTSGAFAGISYTDIVGKSFDSPERKKFFVYRQVLSGSGILISAIIVKQLLSNIEYPYNYQAAFFTAGVLLLIASLGFIFLKEKPSELSLGYRNILEVIKLIPGEIKSNPTLKYFVLSSNLIGFSLVLIPFYIGFIKRNYALTNDEIGNFLLCQIIGIIASNILWNKLIKIISFKGMLKVAAFLLSFTPVLALIFNQFNNMNLFYILFLFNGSAISAQKIAQEGSIIEISNETNRPLYTGIFGTLSLTAAFFPLLLGLMMENINFIIVFLSLSILSLSALLVINKMVCPVDVEKVTR